jgi:hypothetical protein
MNGWSYVEGNPVNFTDPAGFYRFAHSTHLYHEIIENEWMRPAITVRHVEFPILGAGVGGRNWRIDMLTNFGAIFELEPIFSAAAGRLEINNKLLAIQQTSAASRYPTGIIDWNNLPWHLGTQLEFGSRVRVKVNPYYELVADWIENGLVVYWAELSKNPPTIPVPARYEVNERLHRPRYWNPPLNLQPVPQPAYTLSWQEACGYTLIAIGTAILVVTVAEDIATAGIGTIDDIITVPGGYLLINLGQRMAAFVPAR